jgi:hypothetical protein
MLLNALVYGATKVLLLSFILLLAVGSDLVWLFAQGSLRRIPLTKDNTLSGMISSSSSSSSTLTVHNDDDGGLFD